MERNSIFWNVVFEKTEMIWLYSSDMGRQLLLIPQALKLLHMSMVNSVQIIVVFTEHTIIQNSWSLLKIYISIVIPQQAEWRVVPGRAQKIFCIP